MTDTKTLVSSVYCDMTNAVGTATPCASAIVDTDVSQMEDFVVIGNKTIPKLKWRRLNDKGDDHDNRRLREHRINNCQCEVCYREVNKLPPAEPLREKYIARKLKIEQRAIRKVKRMAKIDVKAGKQASIRNFFRY